MKKLIQFQVEQNSASDIFNGPNPSRCDFLYRILRLDKTTWFPWHVKIKISPPPWINSCIRLEKNGHLLFLFLFIGSESEQEEQIRLNIRKQQRQKSLNRKSSDRLGLERTAVEVTRVKLDDGDFDPFDFPPKRKRKVLQSGYNETPFY